MTKVVDDDHARQALPGRPILYVLVVSLVLAGVYLATMVGWSTQAPPENSAVPAPQTSSPAPTPGQAPAANPSPASPGAPASGSPGSQDRR